MSADTHLKIYNKKIETKKKERKEINDAEEEESFKKKKTEGERIK